jgi:hypothetical protein
MLLLAIFIFSRWLRTIRTSSHDLNDQLKIKEDLTSKAANENVHLRHFQTFSYVCKMSGTEIRSHACLISEPVGVARLPDTSWAAVKILLRFEVDESKSFPLSTIPAYALLSKIYSLNQC